MNSNAAFPKLMARSYLSRSQPRTWRMATPIKSPRHIPGLVRIAGILGEVGRARCSSRAVDRRQQDQISPGIVDLPAAERQTIFVVIEPQAVVEHVSKKTLLRTLRGIAGATDTPTLLASHVARK